VTSLSSESSSSSKGAGSSSYPKGAASSSYSEGARSSSYLVGGATGARVATRAALTFAMLARAAARYFSDYFRLASIVKNFK
jgi:hypothetical protein